MVGAMMGGQEWATLGLIRALASSKPMCQALATTPWLQLLLSMPKRSLSNAAKDGMASNMLIASEIPLPKQILSLRLLRAVLPSWQDEEEEECDFEDENEDEEHESQVTVLEIQSQEKGEKQNVNMRSSERLPEERETNENAQDKGRTEENGIEVFGEDTEANCKKISESDSDKWKPKPNRNNGKAMTRMGLLRSIFQILGRRLLLCPSDPTLLPPNQTSLGNADEVKDFKVPLTASHTSTVCEELVSLIRWLHTHYSHWRQPINQLLSSKLALAPLLLSNMQLEKCGKRLLEQDSADVWLGLQASVVAALSVVGGIDSRPRIGGTVIVDQVEEGTVGRINRRGKLCVQLHREDATVIRRISVPTSSPYTKTDESGKPYQSQQRRLSSHVTSGHGQPSDGSFSTLLPILRTPDERFKLESLPASDWMPDSWASFLALTVSSVPYRRQGKGQRWLWLDSYLVIDDGIVAKSTGINACLLRWQQLLLSAMKAGRALFPHHPLLRKIIYQQSSSSRHNGCTASNLSVMPSSPVIGKVKEGNIVKQSYSARHWKGDDQTVPLADPLNPQPGCSSSSASSSSASTPSTSRSPSPQHPAAPKCQETEEHEEDDEQGDQDEDTILLRQLLAKAIQPSVLKPMFSKEEMEAAALALSQYLASKVSYTLYQANNTVIKATSEQQEQTMLPRQDATRSAKPESKCPHSTEDQLDSSGATCQRVPNSQERRKSTRSTSKSGASKDHVRPPSPAPSPMVAQLMEMGFSRRNVEHAIRAL
ncbi:hypothetical protein J437_LFUL015193, partial [Ladona fulva]